MSEKTLILRLSAFLVLSLLMPSQTYAFTELPSEMPVTNFGEWQTMLGDSMIVDTEKNIGYLIHQNGGYTEFSVATGQRRVVRYIGRTYNAKTPNQQWNVLDKETKSDHTTFGKQGLFLRLFNKDGQTAYGIHTHRSIDEMLSMKDRYRSMGCILVSQEVLDTIEATFEGNGRNLSVLTIAGFGTEYVSYETLKKIALK